MSVCDKSSGTFCSPQESITILYGGPKQSIGSKNKCSYLPAFLYLFELFRRNLNEVKGVYISEYHLVC